MKNIHISELMEKREPVSFPIDTSLKDLLLAIMKNWRIHTFYILNDDRTLLGTVSKEQILEFLAPLYCSIDNNRFHEELGERLSEIKAYALMNKEFTCLTMKQYLPEVICLFLDSGKEFLPILDKEGRLIGESSIDSILRTMPVSDRELLYAY